VKGCKECEFSRLEVLQLMRKGGSEGGKAASLYSSIDQVIQALIDGVEVVKR